MTAALVANLTEAIAALVPVIGNEDTRKLLMGLAEGLGAPDDSDPDPRGGGEHGADI